MDKKITASLIAICIISLLIGFGIGMISEKRMQQEKLAQIQQEVDWLKSELEIFYPPLEEEIYHLNGTVIEISDDFLVMESRIRVARFPLPDREMIETWNIKVKVADETEIFRFKWAELPLPEEPLDPQKTTLKLEDIKAGEHIFVTSEENIKDTTEILASQIELYY